jgi:hypothetical protein
MQNYPNPETCRWLSKSAYIRMQNPIASPKNTFLKQFEYSFAVKTYFFCRACRQGLAREGID